MTRKLFWDDPYLTHCKAKVTTVEGRKVKLDSTVFFAFSGGQESDEGTISGIKVINAVKQGEKENIIDIEYELEREPPFKPGDEVEVKIDETRRKNLMMLHSAAHIAYYFIIEKFGRMKIIGSNIAGDRARVDFESEKNLSEGLPEVEERLNTFLSQDRKILRTRDDKLPDLLWWHCESWKMPCGGTHVRSTGEIGKVLLKRETKGTGKERIYLYLKD